MLFIAARAVCESYWSKYQYLSRKTRLQNPNVHEPKGLSNTFSGPRPLLCIIQFTASAMSAIVASSFIWCSGYKPEKSSVPLKCSSQRNVIAQQIYFSDKRNRKKDKLLGGFPSGLTYSLRSLLQRYRISICHHSFVIILFGILQICNASPRQWWQAAKDHMIT